MDKKDVGKERVEGKGAGGGTKGHMVKGQRHQRLHGFIVFITHHFTKSVAVVSPLE